MVIAEEIYGLLYNHFGSQNWWPAETPFEVMVGAVLTQNTNWSNVEKAIENLRMAGILNYDSMKECSLEELAQLIRPSGYYNLKAKRLKNLLEMIKTQYGADLDGLLQDDLYSAREKLLQVKGVGPETADCILLYACRLPAFVVDNYTHRVLSRHNLIEEETDYETLQSFFTDSLPARSELFNEFHALLVKVATTYCRKTKPLCDQCPLQGYNL